MLREPPLQLYSVSGGDVHVLLPCRDPIPKRPDVRDLVADR